MSIITQGYLGNVPHVLLQGYIPSLVTNTGFRSGSADTGIIRPGSDNRRVESNKPPKPRLPRKTAAEYRESAAKIRAEKAAIEADDEEVLALVLAVYIGGKI